MEQEEVWDKIAPWWNEYRNKPLEGVENFLKGKKGRILDLGCGTGRHFNLIKGDIYGVDFSAKMLEIAKENTRKMKLKCTLVKSDASKLPFEDNFFDYAIFIAALHCIESEKKRTKSLEELYRVLKKGGEAMITTWSSAHKVIKRKTGNVYIGFKTDGKEVKRYYYIYKKEELEELLKKLGFKIIRIVEKENVIAIVKK